MKAFTIKALGFAALFTLVGAGVGFAIPAHAAGIQWTYPAIAGFGSAHPLPHAGVQPSKHQMYKALFDVTKGFKNPSKPDAGLVHVARAVNVFVSAGVPLRHLKFIAIVHGPATWAILNNAAYKKKYGVNNPNIALIRALRKAGVHVDVCGQALADNNIAHSRVNKDVRIDLSALSTTVIYGDKGYAYMKQ